MDEVLRLLAEAKTLVLEGKYDEAEEKTRRAEALKKVAEMEKAAKALVETPQADKSQTPVARLPFAPVETEQQPTPASDADVNPAVKTWYFNKIDKNDLEGTAKTLARELYGRDYKQASWEKYTAMKQWLRRGWSDYGPRVEAEILLAPAQLLEAAAEGRMFYEVKATLVEAQDHLSGFAVPEDLRLQVIERLPGMTVVRPLANVMTTSRDVLSMIKRTGGNSRYIGASRVTWVDEVPASAATSATNPTFGKVSIPVHVTMANVAMSRSTLEDSGIDLVGYVREELQNAMAQDEDEQFLVGSGVGKPQGVLNGTAANGAPFDSDVQTVNSGAAAALTGDGIVKVPMKLDAQYRNSPSCCWIGAKATYEAIYLLQDGNGRYLWRSHDDNLATGYPKQLQGYPIKESEALPAIGANKYPLIFGDWKRGYTIADRVGLSLERYQDSNTQATDTVIFYARRRLGGQVVAGWAFVVQKCST